MPKTLDKTASAVTIAPTPGAVTTEMSMIMPPGFTEPVNRPIVYIGGEAEGGSPFYTWNHDDSSREYVPVNRFSGTLLELRTVVKNADDPIKRSVKLVAEFQTATGARVALSCGANTYAAMGMVAGLSNLSATDFLSEIGLSGKVGRSGKVTFISVYANGQLQRNVNVEDLLKEAKTDGVLVDALTGQIGEINAALRAASPAPAIAGSDEEDADIPF